MKTTHAQQEAQEDRRPLIDQAAPARTETATFALG
jgi:hypothetical protein